MFYMLTLLSALTWYVVYGRNTQQWSKYPNLNSQHGLVQIVSVFGCLLFTSNVNNLHHLPSSTIFTSYIAIALLNLFPWLIQSEKCHCWFIFYSMLSLKLTIYPSIYSSVHPPSSHSKNESLRDLHRLIYLQF